MCCSKEKKHPIRIERNRYYRVVSCDENGTWDVVRYQGANAVENMKADYDKLKLRLYEYKETNAHKSVAFCGEQRFQVALNANIDTIKTQISSGITVVDPDHKNQHIPYDGSEVTKTNIGGTEYAVSTKAGYYWLDSSAVNTAVAGEYPVLIKYRNDDGSDTTIGKVSVVVGSGYADLTSTSGTVVKNAGVSTVVNTTAGENSTPATFKINGGDPISITVGMLTDANGNRIDTSKPGTYSGLTLTYQDMRICKNFTLTVSNSDHALDYPAYDLPGSVTVDKGTTTTEEQFAGTGVANIELSATAKPTEKGVDVIFIVDLSSSMRYHVNNSQYACGPKYSTDGTTLNTNRADNFTTEKEQKQYVFNADWWKNTRMAAMENALCDMIKTLSASNTDVQIAIADFGDLDHYEFEDAVLDSTIGAPAGSKPYWDANLDDTGTLEFEMSNHVNFILGRDDTIQENAGTPRLSQPYWLDQTKHNEDYENSSDAKKGPGLVYKYTGKLDSKIFTGDGTLSGAFMNVDELSGQTALNTLTDNLKRQNARRLGTNYDIGLETAYRLAYAREQANIASGDERDIICIFMSDGAAMQYNYLSGRSQTEAWSQCIIGETDEILTNNANKYVITSDPYDTSVNQNPYLQAMLKDLLGVLERGDLIIPDTTTTYPAWNKNDYDGTDFFLAMKSIGVECDWELLWQIAYKLYTHHSTRTVALADGTIIQRDGQNATGAKLLEAVTMSMRKPSYDASGNQYKYQTLSPYYYFYNAEGKNWWAEAIKGDSDKLYPVISRYAFKDHSNPDFYYGDVRNNFVGETTKTYDKNGNQTGTLALEGKDYIAGFRGLGMELYTIGFSLGTENRIDYTEAAKVLDNIATGPAYHYSAPDGETLTSVLQSIASTISTSATRAYFTDTMGPNYDLSTERTVVDKNGNTVTVNANPTVRVLEYTLDTTKPIKDEGGKLLGYERAKDADGNYIVTVRETITFEGDKVAKSDQVYTIVTGTDGTQVKQYPDIWDESTNLITGKFVRYNANKYVDENNTGAVDLYLDGTGRKFTLAAETFFWTIGMIGETEMVLEYQVYLEGSLEGKLPLPKTYYDTNKEAVLHYVNHLGNDCKLDTVTPKFPWGDEVLTVDKTVEATTDANEFLLTLEAYVTGREITFTRPADVVLVLDHSASMHTPVGAPGVLKSGTLYTGGGAIDRGDIKLDKAKHRGYYVAQSAQVSGEDNPTYRWFVMEYVENYRVSDTVTAPRWVGYSVPSTESIVDTTGGYTEHTQVLTWVPGEVDGRLVFYKSQYAMLYDAVKKFVGDLKATGADHRVAIVGFAGSTGDGSRLYVGGDEDMVKVYNAMYNNSNTSEARRTELYQKSLKSLQNEADYGELLAAVEAIETNHSFTCPSAGLMMASDLFAANEVNPEERDRIVVLFTDGIPNKMIDGDENTTETQTQIYNEIVSKACTAKRKGATIYSISTTTLGVGADRKFLSYASSDYPNATSYDDPGTAIHPLKYTNEVDSGEALGNVFVQITENTIVSSVALGADAILKEVLSDYVQLDEDADVQYQVFTQDYLGNGKWGELKSSDAEVVTSPATGRVETIEVTGFNYAENYVSEKTRQDPNDANNNAYRGRKLVLKVYIESREGFWGGNNVPTNKDSTAIYTPETTDPSTGESVPSKVVEHFPMPEVNVPITVDVVAKDKTIYYDGNIDTDGDNREGDELITTVTIGGKEVTVNDDGTFTPQDSWMDDFADAKWDTDSTQPNSNLDNTVPKDYEYTVVVTPNSDGKTNQSENPSNIAGNVNGGEIKPDDLTAPAVSDTDTGHIYILVPELTFKDSTTDFGTAEEGYDFDGNDFVNEKTEWVFMEDTVPTEGAPAVSGEAPELTLIYTPDTDGDNSLENGSFVTDTKVNVSVSMGEGGSKQDITDLVKFDWQDDCTYDDHSDEMDITKHEGNNSSHEFWVHVNLDIVPDTVVIDYGLDVVIDVLTNDPKTDSFAPVLNGIAKNENNATFGKDLVDGTYGELSIDTANTNKVRYSLNDADTEKNNGMQMNAQEVFKYQARYDIKGKEILRDSTVTVIPATTIYYEDSFVKFSAWNVSDDKENTDAANQWKQDGSVLNRDQAQNRPGPAGTEEGQNPPAVDVDYIYGYDSAYTTNMETHSLGSAMKFTANESVYGEAQFTFWGTGFDVISLTSNTTGTITVDVYEADEFDKKGYSADSDTFMVDTYYGYMYTMCNVTYEWDVTPEYPKGHWVKFVNSVSEAENEAPAKLPDSPNDGEKVSGVEMAWIVNTGATGSLYQVPVMKVSGLEYGRYTAVITVYYRPGLDHQKQDKLNQYDFYLDAIRIYDPANDGTGNKTIEDAYVADGEGWPEYFELRNLIISKKDFDSLVEGTGEGIVFIDNTLDTDKNISYSIADYTNFGPNNELYLAPGQSVAFDLAVPGNVAGIHLAMKTVGDGQADVQVYETGCSNNNMIEAPIETATDLYYNITALNNKTVVISNPTTSTAILSITNVKVTYKSKHTDSIEAAYFKTSQESAGAAVASLMMMRPPVAPEVTPLTILVQPADVQVEIGERFSITVEAEGDGLTYQWYYKNRGGKEFAVSSYTGKSYSMTMAEYCHGRQVYCVVSDQYGNSVTSEIATMTRPPQELKILTQPQDVQVEIGEKFSITVKAQGEGLTYQWYYKNRGGKEFAVSSYTGKSYSMTMAEYCHGRQVYCVVSDQYGNSVTSEIATMTRPPQELKILTQPQDVQVEIGEKFSITVKAQGECLTYQWYYKNKNGKEFAVSSYTGKSYSMTMAEYCHGRQVYCVVSDQYGNSVTSEIATMTRPPQELKILTQPQDVQVEIGEKFSITVKAQGEGLTYQWYYKNRGGKEFAVSSYTGKSYSMTMAEYCHGRQVYCVVSDQYGNSVTSEIATMTRPPLELKILTQPQDVQVEIGEKFSITVKAQGEGLTYQWYYKNRGGKEFAASSYTGKSYSMTMANYCDGRQVYCVITDQFGNSVTTEIATMSKAESDT